MCLGRTHATASLWSGLRRRAPYGQPVKTLAVPPRRRSEQIAAMSLRGAHRLTTTAAGFAEAANVTSPNSKSGSLVALTAAGTAAGTVHNDPSISAQPVTCPVRSGLRGSGVGLGFWFAAGRHHGEDGAVWGRASVRGRAVGPVTVTSPEVSSGTTCPRPKPRPSLRGS